MSNNYQDAGHRPHARHTGETPRNEIVEAPYHLDVELDTWGPVDNLFPSIYDALQANWGDMPSRTVDASPNEGEKAYDPGRLMADWADRTGWSTLNPSQRDYVESCFAHKTLQQVLERITFSFLVDGCSRACTHQLVRTRIGAAMMQHGGRDNDWRHRPWVMPETIRRACMVMDSNPNSPNPVGAEYLSTVGLHHCIADWKPLDQYLYDVNDRYETSHDPMGLRNAIEVYLKTGRELYAALVDAGIPWEDARRVLWMGTSTYIHLDYNYIALRDVLANRLEHIMDWEINCVAQLMLREVRMHCPPVFSKYLGSHSDLARADKFAGLQSWPPVGKYPNPYERCATCGHAKANHTGIALSDILGEGCDVCYRNGNIEQRQHARHPYAPVDILPREHRPEQNPFWILSPDSMNGGPIVWIPTNGTYPSDLKSKE